jgi:hypothetical protein
MHWTHLTYMPDFHPKRKKKRKQDFIHNAVSSASVSHFGHARVVQILSTLRSNRNAGES